MLEVNQVTYTAIITIRLPGTDQPASASITLTPQDAIPTGSGEMKLLRDCTLADLNEFAETLEAEVWAAHRERMLTDLALDDQAHVKITILNETGRPLSTDAADWLAHAVIFPSSPTSKEEAVAEEIPMTPVEAEPPPPPVEDVPVSDAAEMPKPEEMAAPLSEEPAEEPAEKAVAQAAEKPFKELVKAEPISEEPAETPPPAGMDTLPSAPVVDLPPPEEAVVEEKPEELRIAGLRRPFGHTTPAAVDILINEPAFRDAQAHSLSSLDREVAGVLVGPMPEKQPDGRYVVHITDIIIAKHTKMHGASVTYTPESWRYIHDRLGERYPNEEALIVGWYHTHPGFGIFLSGMDLFIHQNFFTQIWHVALVLDPVARRSGFFCWNRAKTAVDRYPFPWPEWLARSW